MMLLLLTIPVMLFAIAAAIVPLAVSLRRDAFRSPGEVAAATSKDEALLLAA